MSRDSSVEVAPEGYEWVELNESHPSPTPTFSSSPARVLMCRQCGTLVGNSALHNAWHWGA